MYRRSLFVVILMIIPLGGCREDTSVKDKPLTNSELVQFNDPLHLSCWQEPGSWPQFAHDPLHTGRVDVDLGTTDLEPVWQFRPSPHVWKYRQGFSVWSSPVVGTVDGRCLVIAGYYDSNVYAVNGDTGEKVWEFRPGAPVFASPALGMIDGQARVFVASLNRSIYSLDAATGQQVGQFETAPWSFTQASSIMSSPTIVQDREGSVLVIGVWNCDRSASHNIQSGEVIVLNAVDLSLRWRKRLASVPISSPAVAQLDGELTVFVASQHGVVHALRMADGSTLWKSVLNEETHSSPSIAMVDGLADVLIGSRLNTLFALDGRKGARRWREDTGYWIDTTPAWFVTPPKKTSNGAGRTTVVAGSYDWHVYAWSAGKGPTWKFKTGNFVYSSPAIAQLNGSPVVLFMSWDQQSYLFDGITGDMLWQVKCGPMLWSHAYIGDSLWASPVIANANGQPTVLMAAFDGILYAYRPRQKTGSQTVSGPL